MCVRVLARVRALAQATLICKKAELAPLSAVKSIGYK